MGPQALGNAVLQHQDLITVHDGADALGNDDGGGAREGLGQALAEGGIGLIIQGAGGVVQDQKFRSAGQGPGNEDPLLLAAA